MMIDAKQHILDAGLRPTSARIAVLSAISSADSALSHPEILERLASQKEFDRVTIYRVLDWLTHHHLVHKISGENRAWKFQLSQHKHETDTHQHAHLLCTSCGKISCIHELSPHFPKPLLEKYHVETIDVHFKGLCEDCFSSSP
jgi:Fur family ferric uptake transcriptional regulator